MEECQKDFIDQQNEFKSLEIYLEDILPEDFTKKKKNREIRILNYLSKKLNRENPNVSMTYSLSEDYFIKSISDKSKEIEIDDGKYLKNQITFYPKNNFICIVKLSNQDY